MKNLKLYGLFFMDGVQMSQGYTETVYFLPVSLKDFPGTHLINPTNIKG